MGEHQDRAGRHGEALEADEHGKDQDEALEHEEPRHAADIGGGLEIAPGPAHRRPSIGQDDIDEGEQEEEDADEIGNGLPAQAGRAIEDVDADVVVAQQRKAATPVNMAPDTQT